MIRSGCSCFSKKALKEGTLLFESKNVGQTDYMILVQATGLKSGEGLANRRNFVCDWGNCFGMALFRNLQ